MEYSRQTKVVTYQLQGDETGLTNTVNNAIKKLDALDVKLTRIASRKDVSPIKETETRDAVSRLTSVMKAVDDLAKIKNTLSSVNISLLNTAQIALIKTATKELRTLTTGLGDARNAGKVTQEQLNNTNAAIARIQKLFKLAGIATIDYAKASREASRQAKQAANEEKAQQKAAAIAAKQSAEDQKRAVQEAAEAYTNAVVTIKKALRTLVYVFRRVWRIAYNYMNFAADFGETMNKFNVVAGESSKELGEFAEKMSYVLGLDIQEMYEAVATFKSVANSIHLAKNESETFSKTLTQLAVDLASLYNTDISQAINALTSGLHGQLRPLKNYNIYLYEANLEETRLRHNINKTVNQMNESEKILLRYIAALDQSTAAQGDMAKTLGSAANQIRIAKAQLAQLKRSIGQIFTVIALTIVPALNVLFAGLAKLFSTLAKRMGYEIENFANIFGENADSIDSASNSVDNYIETVKGLSNLDEINLIGASSNGAELDQQNNLVVDKSILDAITTYDNFMDKVEERIGESADKISQAFSGTLISDAFIITADVLKGIGDAFAYVTDHIDDFKPILQSVIDLLTIFLAIKVAKTLKHWGTGLGTFLTKLNKFKLDLPVASEQLTGYCTKGEESVSGLTLAFGALTFAMTKAIFSALYDQFEGKTKQIAGAIGLLVSALTIGATAWMAYHGSMTWGTAVPIITGAIGAGIASLQAMLPKMATGGVVKQPTVAMIGEGKYNEAVVPLGNSPQFSSMKEDIASEVVRKLAQTPSYLSQHSGAAAGTPIVLQMNGREFARAIIPDLNRVQPQTGVKIQR